ASLETPRRGGSHRRMPTGRVPDRVLEYTLLQVSWGERHMLGIKLDARSFLERVAQELGRIDPAQVKALADAIQACYEHGRMVFLCGNGGSGSNASHFCEDLVKGTLRREDFDNDRKKRLKVLSLS